MYIYIYILQKNSIHINNYNTLNYFHIEFYMVGENLVFNETLWKEKQ